MVGLSTLFLIFLSAANAQTVYSSSLYQEQTKECQFPKLSPTYNDSELLALDVIGMRQLYPLSSPWIAQQEFLHKLSEALYKNEADCKNHNLTHWGKNEDFPSLGLPHAIWYGKVSSKQYQEQFPELIRFIRKNLKLNPQQLSWPALLQKDPLDPAPWASQSEFTEIKKISLQIEDVKEPLQLSNIRKKQPAFYKEAYALFEIRHFLSNPQILQLQCQFVLEKTFLSLHRILAASHRESPENARDLYAKIQLLLNSQEGVLAIVDYLNFKGEGLKPSERTPVGRYPWGLKTVLEIMPSKPSTNINQNFTTAALCSLQRLAYHSGAVDSPAQLQRYAWLNGGWRTRVENNYLPKTFSTPRCTKNMAQKGTP